MEEFSASGYYMEPDSPNGVSVDADSLEAREKARSTGRKSGYRTSKGLRRSPRRVAKLKRKGRPNSSSGTAETAPQSAAGSFERTKRLLMAALRVWELKQGIRN